MKFGNVAGIEKPVSRLVQGTVPVSTKDLDGSFSLLDAVIESGGNTFDTAHVYGSGDNERAFGQWLGARNLRDRVVIIAKGAHHNQDRRRVTPFDIAADLHDSLARMRIDFIDLYLLHRDDPDVPVGPIVEALNEHIRAGKVTAWGGSNWSHARIQEANQYAAEHGLVPMAAGSPQFSLANQITEPWPGCITISGPENAAARQFYTQTQLPVFAWSSLAGGFFSGRIRRDSQKFDDYFYTLSVECYASEENFLRLERAETLASARNCTLTQIALAYALQSGMNLFALVGCRTGDEFQSNAEALNIELTAEERTYLERGY